MFGHYREQVHWTLGKAQPIIHSFKAIDGRALPVWAVEHSAMSDMPDPTLFSCCVATGLIYSQHRQHVSEVWDVAQSYLRNSMHHARLSTIQAALLDLNGRNAINPAGNYVRLGTSVAVANLMGLNRDCSQWAIPSWERGLRIRLWWAIVQYDRL